MATKESLKQSVAVEPRWMIEAFEEDTALVPGSRVSGKCTGCDICELICSLHHEGVCNPTLSRIKIRKLEGEWFDFRTPKPFERIVCVQCPGLSPCMTVCPAEGALTRDSDTGGVFVNHDLCTKCGQCVEACPYDAIWFHRETGRILKCDLCRGEPKCVEWCPAKVLRYVKR